VSRKKRQKKPRGKATARNQRREKWELPILNDRRAAMAKVLAEDVLGALLARAYCRTASSNSVQRDSAESSLLAAVRSSGIRLHPPALRAVVLNGR